MTNTEIANRLEKISEELEKLSLACMLNNHNRNERLNALLQGEIDTAASIVKRVSWYINF